MEETWKEALGVTELPSLGWGREHFTERGRVYRKRPEHPDVGIKPGRGSIPPSGPAGAKKTRPHRLESERVGEEKGMLEGLSWEAVVACGNRVDWAQWEKSQSPKEGRKKKSTDCRASRGIALLQTSSFRGCRPF